MHAHPIVQFTSMASSDNWRKGEGDVTVRGGRRGRISDDSQRGHGRGRGNRYGRGSIAADAVVDVLEPTSTVGGRGSGHRRGNGRGGYGRGCIASDAVAVVGVLEPTNIVRGRGSGHRRGNGYGRGRVSSEGVAGVAVEPINTAETCINM
jgi:hypothetical protein